MLKYIVKRLLQSVLTLFIIATVVFFLMRLMPEEGYFGEQYDKMDPEQIEAALQAMGLRDPLLVQLGRYYKQLLHFDFGKSITVRPKTKIAKIIKQKAPYSIKFGLYSVLLSLVIGIPMGTIMALFKGKGPDKIGNAYIVFINAVPAAVYYLFIQLYASDIFHLPILFDEYNWKSLILPVCSMSLGSIASYAMWTRRYTVDQMNKDYVKFARAKGLSEGGITFGHMTRNALVPMAQNVPTSILLTISGSIYIESLYSIPGMGNLLLSAINRQDNPLVQALVLIYSSLGIFGLLLGDLLMVICDPRIKLVRGKGSR